MTQRLQPVKAVVEACKSASNRLGTHSKQLGAKVYSSSKTTVAANVDQLRESAIEPLPQVERMPVGLRKLDWKEKAVGPVDAAAIVRRLRGRVAGQEDRNELGCAYALLAWELSLDQYWLSAITELRAARDGKDDEASERAKANLEQVAAVSGFPVNP